jgi:HK97 family phage major capsid protein
MSDLTKINETVEEINRALTARKEFDERQAAEVKKIGAATGETKETIDKIQTRLGELDDVKSELEKLQKLAARPQMPGKNDDPHFEVNKKHAAAFAKALRHGFQDHESVTALRSAQSEAVAAGAVKAVSVATPSAGGYALPEIISREIHRLAVDMSPMRQLAKVVQAGSTDYKELVDGLGASGGWVGETTSRTETNTPTLHEVAPSFGGVYAYPKATNWSLLDLFFDVETWLRNSAVEQFSLLEGLAFWSGDGSNKPTGLVNGSKSSAGDDDSPARAFGTLEYVPTGKAADFANTPFDSPPGSGADVFIDCEMALRAVYRAGAAWQMNKATLTKVRKFKDANGDYIWQPGLAAGRPSTILGYPVYENPNVASVGSNAYPVAFGKFDAAYVIVDLPGMWMLRDQITTPGYTKFYMEKRVGGKLHRDEAVKLIKCAVS